MRATDERDLPTQLVSVLPQLRRFAMTLTRNAPDADDLVQMTCERALARSHQWQPGTSLASWTYTIARTTWISELRKRKVRIGAGQVDAVDAPELTTATGPADQLRGKELLARVMALPEGLASVLLLVSVEGHSYQGAADILDIPIGTVMSRMSSARKTLRQNLQEEAI